MRPDRLVKGGEFGKRRARGRRAVGLALAAAGGAAALALAQEAAQEAEPRFFEMNLEDLLRVKVAEVTTASKRSETVREAPGTVLVIDKRAIRLRGYATLQDVLRDMPGMETVPYHFSEIGTLVPVRGIAGNNKIVVLVNGMRVNPPGGELFPIRNDISVRNAEQIEIVYGPGSTLYGQDAIAAVINIKTERPDGKFGGEGGLAGGPDATGEGWATLGGTFLDGRVRLQGHVRAGDSELTDLRSDYPKWWQGYEDAATPRGAGTDPVRSDEGLNVFGRVESDASSIQVWHRDSRRSSSEGFSPILGYLPEARWHDMTTVVEGRNTYGFSDAVDLQSALTYSRYEIDPESRYVFPASETEWFLNDFKYGIGIGITLEETLSVRVRPGVELLGGVVGSGYAVTPKATVPGGADPNKDISAQAGSFVYFTEAGNPATRQEIRRAVTLRYETYAGYLEGAWQIVPAVKAIAGVRVTEDTRFSENPVTPRGSVVWGPTDRLTAKYTYAEAYVAPAPYFVYSPFDNGTLLSTSNPDVEPETSASHELALQYRLDRGFVSLSLYRGEQDNLLIVADAGSPLNTIQEVVFLEDGTTRKLVHTVNGGHSRSLGADLYAELRFGPVSPWGSYSYVDYEEDTDGVQSGLRGISAHNVRLGATWAVTSKLFVTPSLVLRSTPENVRPGPLDSELETPWELNLNVLYKLTRHIDAFATLANVTDNAYALGGFTGDAVPQETFHGVVGLRGSL